MTERQKRFCEEYLIDCNATRAGYSSKGAGQSAEKLLKNTEIQSYLQEQMKVLEDAKVATADEVVKYLTSVLRGETKGEEIVVEGLGDGISKAKSIMKAPSEKDKLKAAELLGKRYGLFKESVNVELEPIVISNDLVE